jgi:2-iminobutanoate/2-iminopropanoate deaminase
MNNKKIITKNAPLPIGPYTQATEANGFIFISGQIALDPESGKLVNSDISNETRQVMKNIQGILMAAELSFDNIVKASIFLKDLNNFQIVNEEYALYFSKKNAPARECVEVSRLPKDVNVEISVIAAR